MIKLQTNVFLLYNGNYFHLKSLELEYRKL